MIAERADVETAAAAPYLLPREWKRPMPWGRIGPVARAIEGDFAPEVIEGVRSLGQPVAVLRKADSAEWGGWRGYWLGASIDPDTGAVRAAPARDAVTAGERH
jgi:hypothetical protein